MLLSIDLSYEPSDGKPFYASFEPHSLISTFVIRFNYSCSLQEGSLHNICKTVQSRLMTMQDSWLSKKAEEIQTFADRKDMKKFHDALKAVYGPKSSGTTPLFNADGSTLLTDKDQEPLTDKDAILERWAEHFCSMLNRPSTFNDNAINRLPQYRWCAVSCLMNSKLSLKQRNQFNICYRARSLVQMQ